MKYKMFVDDDGELKEVLDTGEFDALRALIAEEVERARSTAAEADSTIESTLRDLIADVGGEAETAKNSVPTGTVIAFAANSEPPGGYLLCNGAAVSRTTYATLFAVIGGTYGVGDGSTTFNLPDLTDKFIQGRATAGGVIDAGLPNITGWVTTALNSGGGAFLLASTQASYSVDDGAAFSFGWHVFDFNAGRSNGLYGNSNTVQPPTVTMRYYIKY